MHTKAFDVKKALIKSGKKEFLAHGFDNASLRTICKNADVTTGAFYAHFARKEELFCAIVEPTVHAFFEMYDRVMQKELSDLATGEENELESIAFIRGHKEEFRLLFDGAAGTKYAGFKDYLIDELFAKTYQLFFDRYAGVKVDPTLVKIILAMKFTEYMELIYGRHKEEEVKELTKMLTTYTEGGFKAVIREMRQKNTKAMQ